MHQLFEPLTMERQPEYDAILSTCPQLTSDYAFANIWGWAEHYGMEWAFANGLVWLRQTAPEPLYWAPIGPWANYQWASCDLIRETGRFTRVPEQLAGIWREAFGDDIELVENRDHWDYVYDVEELIELRGNKFHKKKNLLKQFQKKYDFEYTPMGPECVEEVLDMQAEWYKWYEEDNEASEALHAENVAITRVLHNIDRIPTLMGGTIRVESKVVAYTVAEPIGRDMLVIHFEKGDTRFKGIYQAINQMFLEQSARQYKLVNREQDLGEPGLRKAKESYNPVEFLKKYEATIKK